MSAGLHVVADERDLHPVRRHALPRVPVDRVVPERIRIFSD